jgi:predicted small secreted protein
MLPVLVFAAMALMRMTACETTEGAGRDLGKLGNNIEDAAKDAK